MNAKNFTIPTKELKSLGYTFQKLYANNYQCYHKKVGYNDIWLWVAGKQIEVNDWHQHTQKIIDFYLANQNHIDFGKDGQWETEDGFLSCLVNYDTGEIIVKDFEEQWKASDEKKMKEYWAKWKNWYELIYHKDQMENLLAELKILNQ